MGLYDTVVIEGLKLKTNPEINSFLKKNNATLPTEYQTKDLDNFLSTFIIKGNGQIYQEIITFTGDKKPLEPIFTGWKDSRSFIERLIFNIKNKSLLKKVPRFIRETKKTIKKSNLTNTFSFYTFEEIGGRLLDVEYRAEAVRGKIKSISLEKYNIESEKDSKKRIASKIQSDRELQEKINLRNKFTAKWYYPILRETYNPFVFIIKSLIVWSCNSLIRLTYKWHGV